MASTNLIRNAFVRARLLPGKSSCWLPSQIGQRLVPEIVKPQWFNALRIHSVDTSLNGERDLLFVVSSYKNYPRANRSIPIFPNHDGDHPPIRVNPPLPANVKLYIHTCKQFRVPKDDSAHWNPPPGAHYTVEQEDLERIIELAQSDGSANYKEKRKQLRQMYGSGGNEEARSSWSTFSTGRTESDRAVWFKHLSFEFSELEDYTEHGPPTIYDEETALRRVWADYSWDGVHETFEWADALINANAISQPKVSSRETIDPRFPFTSPSEQMLYLHSLHIPYDGEPPAKRETVEDDDPWGDDDFLANWQTFKPDFTSAPAFIPAVPPSRKVRAVCFDACGTLVDRELGLAELIRTLLKERGSSWQIEDALSVYIECEANQQASRSHVSYHDLVTSALIQFSSRLGIEPLSKKEAEGYARQALDWPVWNDVPMVLALLKRSGLQLVASPFIEDSIFTPYRSKLESAARISFDHIITSPTVFGLHDVDVENSSRVMDELKKYCSSGFESSFHPEEVMVVTSSGFRGVRPASAAGFLTAHLSRPDSLSLEGNESIYELSGAQPTCRVSSLAALYEFLSSL